MNSYLVVGECGVHFGHGVLRHVATHTVFPRNRANSPVSLARHTTLHTMRRIRFSARVAGQTVSVVGNRVTHQRLMRSVACGTGKARIASAPAAAAFQSIRRKAQSQNSAELHQADIDCGAMAGSAIINRCYRAEVGGIQDERRRGCPLRQVHGSHVLGAGSMASLAGNSRNQTGVSKWSLAVAAVL